MYTIFINDLIVHVTKNEPAQGLVKNVVGDQRVWMDENWKGICGKSTSGRIYIATEDPDHLWQLITSRYQLIEAAGGLVTNSKGEILFIHRLGKWDLPKGKLEEGENIRECALREVEEECGIQGHTIIEELPSSFHTYTLNGVPILKKTYWYWMRMDGRPELTPQIEEDITETVWLKESEWKKVEENTYPSIKSLLETYRFGYK